MHQSILAQPNTTRSGPVTYYTISGKEIRMQPIMEGKLQLQSNIGNRSRLLGQIMLTLSLLGLLLLHIHTQL